MVVGRQIDGVVDAYGTDVCELEIGLFFGLARKLTQNIAPDPISDRLPLLLGTTRPCRWPAANHCAIMVIGAPARDAAGDIRGMSRLAYGVDWARVRASLGHSFGFTSAYFSLFPTGDLRHSPCN